LNIAYLNILIAYSLKQFREEIMNNEALAKAWEKALLSF